MAIWSASLLTSATPSTILLKMSLTSVTALKPRSALCWEDSIKVVVLVAASAALVARERTSSATTANPAPASPALAASTAALSESRLVWKEISWMLLIDHRRLFGRLLDQFNGLVHDLPCWFSASSREFRTSWATLLVSLTLSALALVMEVTSLQGGGAFFQAGRLDPPSLRPGSCWTWRPAMRPGSGCESPRRYRG